jgi:hypothetical protein
MEGISHTHSVIRPELRNQHIRINQTSIVFETACRNFVVPSAADFTLKIIPLKRFSIADS